VSIDHSKQPYWRGVYGVFNSDNILVYVGSSSQGIEKLEENHRQARTKYGEQGMTYFRRMLEQRGSEFRFVWLIKPFQCVAETIENMEGQLIRELKPMYNRDKNPVWSSKKYGRY